MNPDFERLATQEWLLTNGIGGFASGTVAGCATRRYHSLLTVALDPPTGRRMSLLGGLDETVILEDGTEIPLATHVYEDGTVYPDGWKHTSKFDDCRWDFALPNSNTISRRYEMADGANAIRIVYRSTCDVTLRLAPLVCWKDIHQEMAPWEGFPIRSEENSDHIWNRWVYQPTHDAPTVEFRIADAQMTSAGWWNQRIFHQRESERGFNATESLFCPVVIEVFLKRQKNHVLRIGCIEPRSEVRFPEAKPPVEGYPMSVVRWKKMYFLSMDYLVTCPPNLGAGGQNIVGGQIKTGGQSGRTTIIAGYPWFTDWGRDTFISLPGLCLTTGREETARQIVRDFAPWVKDGRIPNRFPDDPQKDPPAYNNVDGTLWYVRCIGLCGLTEELRPTLDAILGAHLAGNVGDGIFCDDDGLLRCGNDHTNLTWMDAKVDGVPITPRFDRPVEVQALWIHALTVGGRLAEAESATESFRAKFVRPDGLGLWDCLFPDGTPDRTIRPGMVIAAALLDLPDEVNRAILETASEHLLTPFGLRTLAPSDSAYAGRYEGDGRRRDSVYHQGTVWPWLLGSFLDLYKKVHGADADVSAFLGALEKHLNEDYGLGGIAEIFDGDAPHRPNGCPWQAWSLAEYLRHRDTIPA